MTFVGLFKTVERVRFGDLLAGAPLIVSPERERETFTAFGIRFVVAEPVIRPTDESAIHIPGEPEPLAVRDHEPIYFLNDEYLRQESVVWPWWTDYGRAAALSQEALARAWQRVHETEPVMNQWVRDGESYWFVSQEPAVCWWQAYGYGPRVDVAGDAESAVSPDTIDTLVDLARAGNRADFEFLAGASGVPKERHAELWDGTRRRLGLSASDA